jgi:hypothetical protein
VLMGRSSLLVVTACTECVYWLLVPRAIPGGSVLCAVTQVCSCEPEDAEPCRQTADRKYLFTLCMKPVAAGARPTLQFNQESLARPFLSLADQVHIRLLLSPVCLATWPADL